jgi:CBS domain-containing protein
MRFIESFIRQVITTTPQHTVAAVGRLMQEHNVGAVVVVENLKPVGIVTDRDLALDLAARGVPPQAPVTRVMTSPVETVARDDGIFTITECLMERRVRRLAVVDDDGLLVGIVTLDDLLRVLSRELTNLVDSIRSEMEVK